MAFAVAVAGLSPGAAAHAQPVPPVAPAAGGVAIDGAVLHPENWTAATLKTLPPTTLTVSFATGHGEERARWTGVLLWTLLGHAGIVADPRVSHASLRRTLLATGSDGYAVAFSVGELDPDLGAAPVLVAYARDGVDLAPGDGLRLVVPGDKLGARAVRGLVRITVQ
jgi:DMSO/TMAO reductase YedYZ molybdopterin-dependent catalytic subunit